MFKNILVWGILRGMEYKYQGIILNKRDIGEADRIYTIYTLEAGKIRILGKGVRKPNAKLAGNLESVTQAEIFIAKNKGMGKVTGSIPANNFSNIKTDLDLLNKVFYAFRVLSRLISEEEKDEKIFKLLEEYLSSMDELGDRKDKADILTSGFLFKILDEMGYRLEVEKCVHCGKRLLMENNYFSVARGGTLCGACRGVENKKMPFSNDSIKLVRIFLRNKIRNFTKLDVPAQDADKLRIIVRETLDWLNSSILRFD